MPLKSKKQMNSCSPPSPAESSQVVGDRRVCRRGEQPHQNNFMGANGFDSDIVVFASTKDLAR